MTEARPSRDARHRGVMLPLESGGATPPSFAARKPAGAILRRRRLTTVFSPS